MCSSDLSEFALEFQSLKFWTTTAAVFSLTVSEQYMGYWYKSEYISSTVGGSIPGDAPKELMQSLIFRKKIDQSEFSFTNTLSAYEYGEKVYALEQRDFVEGAGLSLATVANALLDEKAQPKERISIKTEFLEGDLELFDKVTINWRPDSDNPAVYEGTDYDSDDVGSSIGNIDWDSKDFWVIAYRHSWRDQSTQYTLREV